MTSLARELTAAFGERARPDVPLRTLTTFRLGGRAEWVVDAHGADELRRLVAIVGSAGTRLIVLGGGSNVLVADAGVRGVVVRIHGGQVRRLDEERLRADAGVTINGLVRWTIAHGLGGIETWAGTPGTVGGAVYGNAHFQNRLVSELITGVALLTPSGRIVEVSPGAMDFGYDFSRLHHTREIVISADCAIYEADVAQLRQAARASLAFRKRTQPLSLASAGCIFQNPDPVRDALPPGVPASAGALVDRAGMKGAREGGALVSPVHANFIVNDGTATAADVRALITRCKAAVHGKFGINLIEEIVHLGFEDEQQTVRAALEAGP